MSWWKWAILVACYAILIPVSYKWFRRAARDIINSHGIYDARWKPIATIPDDRNVLVSNGKYVMVGYLNSLGHLTWAGDEDTLLSDATHWMDKVEKTPLPSSGEGRCHADFHQEGGWLREVRLDPLGR